MFLPLVGNVVQRLMMSGRLAPDLSYAVITDVVTSSGEPSFLAESVPSSRRVTNERVVASACAGRRRKPARVEAIVIARAAIRYIAAPSPTRSVAGDLRTAC